MEDQKELAVGRVLRRLGSYIKEITGFAPGKIPLEVIDRQTVSMTIRYNILAEGRRLGDRSNILFSASSILPNLGYRIVWAGEDYKKKFPAEYEAVRRELDRLVREGMLTMVPVKEQDTSHEIHYRVVNKEALIEIANTI